MVWQPGQQTVLAVVTGQAVHLYDLTQAVHMPMLTLTAPSGSVIVSADFCRLKSLVQRAQLLQLDQLKSCLTLSVAQDGAQQTAAVAIMQGAELGTALLPALTGLAAPADLPYQLCAFFPHNILQRHLMHSTLSQPSAAAALTGRAILRSAGTSCVVGPVCRGQAQVLPRMLTAVARRWPWHQAQQGCKLGR